MTHRKHIAPRSSRSRSSRGTEARPRPEKAMQPRRRSVAELVECVIRTMQQLAHAASDGVPIDVIASDRGMSIRTTRRFLGDLARAGVPVYSRKAAGGRDSRWIVELPRFLRMFTR